MVAGRDTDSAGGFFPELAQGLELGLDLLKPRSQSVKQAFTRIGR